MKARTDTWSYIKLKSSYMAKAKKKKKSNKQNEQ